MESSVKQRLIKYLETKKIGRNKFEAMAGISLGYITHLKNSPGAAQLVKILTAAPDLNRDWLLTGDGSMLNTSDVTPMASADLQPYTTTKAGMEFSERADGQIIMQVPIVPISALGSPADEYATLIAEGNWETMPFIVDSVHHGKYFAFRVEGDSMDNGTRESFARKDIVLVRELARDKWLPRLHYNQWPYWVVVFGNNVRIKQIIDQDDQGNITLHSLNPSPEYTDFTLCLDDISRLFNVIQHIPHPNIF